MTGLRVCLVYDCLYPWTVGGAERWYRTLAEHLAAAGHHVTYLTRQQWPDDTPPDLPGVDVVAVSRREPLYGPTGNRLPGPPVRFGVGVGRHLARHRSAYDVVHTCAFPYFPVFGIRAALAGRRGRPRVVVDWVEVWTAGYWRSYLGPVGGRVGTAVQRAAMAATPTATAFSRLHAARLVEEGYRRPVTRLAGLYDGPGADGGPPAPTGDVTAPREPLVVFAGRHIPDKRAHLVPAVVAAARAQVPGLRGLILGDGPEHDRVRAAVAAAGAQGFVEVAGFVSTADVDAALARATCLLLPSGREGHGLVVVEAAAYGTPAVVVADPDNAATELVVDGETGVVARTASLADLAAAAVTVHRAGAAMRRRTLAHFASHAAELSAARSLATLVGLYRAS